MSIQTIFHTLSAIFSTYVQALKRQVDLVDLFLLFKDD